MTRLAVARPAQAITSAWRNVPVHPRGSTQLGISFRPRQAEAMGLDVESSLRALLVYPFEIVRLGAYWNRIEPEPGDFRPDELDRQIDAAVNAGKQIIVCVGAIKTFGYPEFFVPAHHLDRPLLEGRLVTPDAYPALLDAAITFVGRIVERYRDCPAVIAWQVEHDAVDPLGMEHSWRLSSAFVGREVAAVRATDPSRPVMLNGFLPTSLPVAASQAWRTRGQGDSLAEAKRTADIVGIDFYPRHALTRLGSRSVYLDGGQAPSQQGRRRRLLDWAAATPGRQLMVCEGQAEPWETVTEPPNPDGRAMFSCLPEHVIANYNQCMGWTDDGGAQLSAYLFWGAEYWLLRRRGGDRSYLDAFARVLDEA